MEVPLASHMRKSRPLNRMFLTQNVGPRLKERDWCPTHVAGAKPWRKVCFAWKGGRGLCVLPFLAIATTFTPLHSALFTECPQPPGPLGEAVWD